MVARHDRERAALTPKIGQSAQAFRLEQVGFTASGGHPEVAEVTSDDQGIGKGQAAQPGMKPPVSIRLIESKVDITGEIMRHVQIVPTAVGS